MQPDPVRAQDTKAWVRKCLKDLRRAESALASAEPDTEDALFHLQQAVEKVLKAYLVWRDQPFRKTHDLLELSALCREVDPELSEPLQGLAPLTRYAWESRYPGQAPEPAVEEAQSWLLRARQVLGLVLSCLPEEAKA
jgi:HEPN domain-containing protein